MLIFDNSLRFQSLDRVLQLIGYFLLEIFSEQSFSDQQATANIRLLAVRIS